MFRPSWGGMGRHSSDTVGAIDATIARLSTECPTAREDSHFDHRKGCHLCDDMRDALHVYKDELDFDWFELDVDADPELRERYHVDVPVLLLDGAEVCHHFFDLVALRSSLRSPA